jgi:5'(3')-deoxyribonucleotidase
MAKKIVYVDMDGVLVDFEGSITDETKERFKDVKHSNIPHIFATMLPMENAVESFKRLFNDPKYDVYIQSACPWTNPTAYGDKINWVKRYIEPHVPKIKDRVILSSHKNLTTGDFIIDDRTKKGVAEFNGRHIHFGTEDFPDWESILKFLNVN